MMERLKNQAQKSLAGLKSELDMTHTKLQQPGTAYEVEHNLTDASNWHEMAGSRPPGQWFLAGACVSTVPRARAFPGRHFEGFSGQLNDPIQEMREAGFNAVRVLTKPEQPLGPTDFQVDNEVDDLIHRERNYLLDWGGIDQQVALAEEARALGMQVILTINMGQDIPPAWEGHSYAQMLEAIGREVARQLTPFLQAGVQPDIILLENEGTDGQLFFVTLPGGQKHPRGVDDGLVPPDQLRRERCGELPSGNIQTYPQMAGYLKHQVRVCKQLLQSWGMNPRNTRFGLHSHGQYFDFKLGIQFATDPDLERVARYGDEEFDFQGVISPELLQERSGEVLDILGFSGYPEPMVAADFDRSFEEYVSDKTFDRLKSSLAVCSEIVPRYGRWDDGPFRGQWRKQVLVVEYATAFPSPQATLAQQRHTEAFFALIKAHEWVIGALWWEPTYAINNWAGDEGSLYRGEHTGDVSILKPIDTLATWGAHAESPAAHN